MLAGTYRARATWPADTLNSGERLIHGDPGPIRTGDLPLRRGATSICMIRVPRRPVPGLCQFPPIIRETLCVERHDCRCRACLAAQNSYVCTSHPS